MKNCYLSFMAFLFVLYTGTLNSQSTSNKPHEAAADSAHFLQKSSESPAIVDYQGFLSTSQGEPITGSLSVTFSLWDDPVSGSALWQETQSLDVRLGYFTASLGSVRPLPDQIFAGEARWLQVEIGGEPLTPRKRINSVAHALNADNAASLNGITAFSFYTKAQANSAADNEIDAAKLGGFKATDYMTKSQANAQYINRSTPNTINSTMIVDGTIQRADMGFDLGSNGGNISKITTYNGLDGGGSSGDILIGLTPPYQSGQVYDTRFTKRGEVNGVTGAMIADENITSIDIKNGAIGPEDLSFTAGTINGVTAGNGLQGGGKMGAVSISLAANYQSGAAYDGRFVPRHEANGVTSAMIRDGDVSSLDIKDGSIGQVDMSFAAGDITAVRGNNGISGNTQSGEAILSLETAYQTGAAFDSRFIKRNQESAVNSMMILNGTIQQEDMGFAAGDITGVTATGGLTGGGASGNVSLQLDPAHQTGSAYETMFVDEDQFESITSQMIKDGQVQMSDIANGSLRGFHVGSDFNVQQNKTSGAVMSAVNQAYSANSSGLEGRGYQGVRGIGSHTGVYAEGATYGLYAKANDSQSYALYVDGKAHCTSGDWGDLAEYVPSDEKLEPGDVVVIDADEENKIKRCDSVADRRVAGIISTAPTITVGLEKPNERTFAVALAGIVPCKVVAHEPIRPGDLLTTSGTPGYAQKAADPQIGTIVGKALEGLSTGKGVIRVLVTRQ